MRTVRLIFVTLVAVVLIGVALANRGPVTFSLLPGQLGQYLGGTWSITVPLFLLILITLLVGMVLGLVWEWLREAGLRSESARRAQTIAELERESGTLRRDFSAPKDDVLMILDAPQPVIDTRSGVPAPPPEGGLPAPLSQQR